MPDISFYWVNNRAHAESDAAIKGIASDKWEYFETPKSFDIEKYEAVYFQAGNILMEQEFAKIQKRFRPSWLC